MVRKSSDGRERVHVMFVCQVRVVGTVGGAPIGPGQKLVFAAPVYRGVGGKGLTLNPLSPFPHWSCWTGLGSATRSCRPREPPEAGPAAPGAGYGCMKGIQTLRRPRLDVRRAHHSLEQPRMHHLYAAHSG